MSASRDEPPPPAVGSGDLQRATVRDAVRSFLDEKDPMGLQPRRTLFNCGAVILASAALYWAVDSRAADIVLMQTEAIRQAVAHYPDHPYEDLAIPMNEGTAIHADGLAYLVDGAPGKDLDPLRKAFDVPECPGWRDRLASTISSHLQAGWAHVSEAVKALPAKALAGAAAAFPFIIGAVRLAFEIKGAADTLISFYKRRRGISEDQRIDRLEQELGSVRKERDALAEDLRALSGRAPSDASVMEDRIRRMERQMTEDRARIEALMSRGMQAYLGDLDQRKVTIRLPKEAARALAQSAALTGASPSAILEDKLSEYAQRKGLRTDSREEPLMTGAEQREVLRSASRVIKVEDGRALASMDRSNYPKAYQTAVRHLREKHAALEGEAVPVFRSSRSVHVGALREPEARERPRLHLHARDPDADLPSAPRC